MKYPPQQIECIFHAATELEGAGERQAYLNEVCGEDTDLRVEIEELLEGALVGEALLQRTSFGGEPVEEQPGESIGRYKLLERLGEGGCGVVFLAEQENPVRRSLALKLVKPGMDSRQVVARFEAERQALALMDHPNIAKVHDGGATDKGRPYFVMELVRGIRITDYCEARSLPVRERLDLFLQICSAVQHAHQKGIIHRDLKPSNILVTENEGRPVPKVIDFGIAKATEQKLTDGTRYTQFSLFVGTPAYMSPEQAAMTCRDVDTRSDIYSLGVLLYELLTGSTPFHTQELLNAGFDEMRRVIRETEPPKPSTRLTQRKFASPPLPPNLPLPVHFTDLDWIVMKCLEKDRTRRYETASGLAADLHRFLANEPVAARPPTPVYRFRKMVCRNKLVFAAASAIGLALVMGVVGTTIGLRRAEKQRQAAEQGKSEAEGQRRRVAAEQQRSRQLLYVSDMNLAQQALKADNLGQARRLLDRHRPSPGEEDLRGWEWRYLWQLSRSSEIATLANRPTPGCSVSFSPDGKSLAVGWWDGRVDLWDVPSRQWVRALTEGERPHVGKAAFSPVGTLLVATSDPKMVTLYDLDSGRESLLWRAPDQDEWEVRDLAFSRDGSKVVIYAGSNSQGGDAVSVVNVSTSQVESIHPAGFSHRSYLLMGAARLSPDNRHLYLTHSDYLNDRYRIQCVDVGTGQKLWQTLWHTGSPSGLGPLALEISPDGRVLASGAGFSDTTIHIWDADTGELLKLLERHTSSVYDLAFTQDGRRLMSAAGDQTIRIWDTNAWMETDVLRGHTGGGWAIAISEPAQLIASVSKDGDLKLWKKDAKHAADGYRRLPESLGADDVQPLDRSRVLLLPQGKPPEWVDLEHESPPVPLPEIGPSTNVLGCFDADHLCIWNGTNQILVGGLRGAKFVQRASIPLDSGLRPTGVAYNPARQLLAWAEGTSSASVYLSSLAAPGRRIELRSDVPGLIPFRFSEEGKYLAAVRKPDRLRVWDVETERIVASIDQNFSDACFAAKGSVLVGALRNRIRNEIGFYDLAHPDRAPQRAPGGFFATGLTVSPDGLVVSASERGGQVLLFDPAKGGLIESLHGHLIAATDCAFSPDGTRLFSIYGRDEAVKIWDVGTRQELLTLAAIDSSVLSTARWSADGNVILAGPPWHAWSAPSWEKIEATEAKEKSKTQQP